MNDLPRSEPACLYDDRRTHTYFPSKTNPGQISGSDYEKITYNALGHREKRRTRTGDEIKYTHDALGRLIEREVPDAPKHSFEGRTVTHSYEHDAWGHIEEATHDGQTIVTAFDVIGRVDSQSYAEGRVVDYEWDDANNLKFLTWPNGFTVKYVWDANNRIDQAIDVASSFILADVNYDAQSRWDAVAYGNGTSESYDWTDTVVAEFVTGIQKASPPVRRCPLATAQAGRPPRSELDRIRNGANSHHYW